ncbi:MAG: SCO family protein [Candidatus Heimdallarchaeota archaeon]
MIKAEDAFIGIAVVATLVILPLFFFVILANEEPLEPLEDLGVAPDFDLTDENNMTVSLASYGDAILLIDFIYTNCPDPDFCPLTTSKMRSVQDELLANGFSDEDFHLLSISFDWRYDGPTQMKAYGISYGANFTVWSFLSGSREQINKTIAAYNVLAFDTNDSIYITHTLVLTLVDASDHIRAIHTANDWTAETVIQQAIQLIKEKK